MFTDSQKADLLRVGIANAEKAMARNLNTELYGDTSLASYLANHGRKPIKLSGARQIARWRHGIGVLFLRCANALGAYNEYD